METRSRVRRPVKLKSPTCTLCSEISGVSELNPAELAHMQNILGSLVPEVAGILDESSEQSVLCTECDLLLKEAARLHDLLETLNSQLNSVLLSIKAKVVERSLEVKEEEELEDSDLDVPPGEESIVIKEEVESDEDSHVPSDSGLPEADEPFSTPSSCQSSSSSEDDSYEPPSKSCRTIRKRSRKIKSAEDDDEKSYTKLRTDHSKDFLCTWCSIYFKTKEDKFLHYESIHFKGAAEDVEGGCLLYSRICGRSSLTPGDLSRHNETFHDSSFLFRCLSCDKKFMSEDLLEAHQVIHSPINSFPCSLCLSTFPVTFDNPSELDNHILRVHVHTHKYSKQAHSNRVGPECIQSTYLQGKKSTCCRWCGSKMRGLHVLRLHERQAHPERFTFVCSFADCCSTFAEESHVLTCQETHRDSPGPFKCFVCQITCPSASELKEHLASKHTASGVKCDECPEVPLSSTKRFLNVFQLKAHKVTTHGKEWTHKCPICQKGFQTPFLMKDHLRTAHKDSNHPAIPKPYECSDCGKHFNSYGAHYTHKQVEHKGQKNFVCEVCGKILRTKYILKQHMQTHGEDRNLICHSCGKGFVNPKIFKAHLTTHTEESPLQSPPEIPKIKRKKGKVCKTEPKNKKKRKQSRNHVCQYCGKTYDRPHRLEAHTAKQHPQM